MTRVVCAELLEDGEREWKPCEVRALVLAYRELVRARGRVQALSEGWAASGDPGLVEVARQLERALFGSAL